MIFVDRSNVNGSDDYHAAGVTHLYLKATEGTGFVDSTYHSRRRSAREGGVHHIGAYHFADLGSPVAEAQHFYSVVGKPASGDLRPCLDLERGTVVSDVAWAEAWCREAKSLFGEWPAIYGSTSLIAPMRQSSKLLASLAWWRAEYGPNDGQPHPLDGGDQGAAAHQYTSVGVVPGLSGNVDRSLLIDAHHLLIRPRLEAVVTTGDGARFVYKQGHLWRTRTAMRVLRLLRAGKRNIAVQVRPQ